MKIQIGLTHQERNLFNKELNQHIGFIENSLIELEQGYQKELIEQLFRSFHTIKGNAGMIGYTSMQEVSAETEHVLQHFRQNDITLTEESNEALFTAVDYIKNLTKNLSKSSFDVSDSMHNEVLEIIRKSLPSQETNASLKTNELTQKEESPANLNATVDGISLEIYLNKEAEMPAVTFYQVIHLIEENKIQFESNPTTNDIKNGKSAEILHIKLLKTLTNEEINTLLREIAIIDDIQFVKKIFNVKKREKNKGNLEVREIKNTKEELSEVQIDISQLDDLINQLGEIIINRNQIADALTALEEKYPLDNDFVKLSETTSKLWKSSYRLQSLLLNIRSIPLHSVLDKYHRLSREIAKKINKKIRLEITGQELKLDRIILNYLNDILIHLVRNSIDHGIELPEDRKNIGKDSTGTIKIIAEHKNNKAIFLLSDDGKGLDADVIVKKIIDKKILSKEETLELTKEQIFDYIFHPGFSTKENVSDISGRGVGMDVVKNTIQKLGGGITLSSEKNKGTTFKITLPLTMAIIKGLITEIDKKIFIIPITYIEEIIDIADYETKPIHNHPHIIFREEVIPVFHLKELFFKKKTTITNHTKGVVLSFSDKSIILIVDKIIDEQEIVIKNIDFVDQLYYLIHSATILGTGDIGLILDISSLFDEIKRKYNLH
ncbi:MAG: chemotaxis protein CheA [Candidatus Margulisbacteria bacterium]|nr:chemotaxis protein CheA [Candidatus Margulisiibacteriota bacterium]